MTHEDEQVGSTKKLLKSAFRPTDRRLRRDLWSSVLNRLQEEPVRLPWYDWALIAFLACWAVALPQGILQLVYQF